MTNKDGSSVAAQALRLLPQSRLPRRVSIDQVFQSLWNTDCEWEARARRQLASSDGELKREHLRQWWYVVEALLRDYRNYAVRERPFILPAGLIEVLCETAGSIAAGKIPDIIAAAAGRGSPGRGPQECEQIEIACAYVQSVRAGLIMDRAPIKSIADAFGVCRRSARRWVKEDRLRCEVFYPSDPEVLRRLMIAAGAAYSKTGRSSSAILERARGLQAACFGSAGRQRPARELCEPFERQKRGSGSWRDVQRSSQR